jgi:hypothetical protein
MVRAGPPGTHTIPTRAIRATGTARATVVRAGVATTTRCLRVAQGHAATAAGTIAGAADRIQN